MTHTKPCNKESCTVCSSLGPDFLFFDDTNTTFVLDTSNDKMFIRTPKTDRTMKNHEGEYTDNKEARRKVLKEQKERRHKEMLRKQEVYEDKTISYTYRKGKLLRTLGIQTETCVYFLFDKFLREKCVEMAGFYTTVSSDEKDLIVYRRNGNSDYESIMDDSFLFCHDNYIEITNKFYDIADNTDDEDEEEEEGGFVGVSIRARDGSTKNYMYWENFPDPLSSDEETPYNSDDEYYRDSELEDVDYDTDDNPVYWI
ncbi:unnamed protein product [Auanema sp. JU1783]|nr:unnamed protein product [Auanema sp. JU1783]